MPGMPNPARKHLPASAWALGLVSLLMDFSSECIHSLLPMLLVGPLGAGMSLVGWIEGIAEATASFTKIGSGWLSDRMSRRRPLVIAGYGLAALSKPVFPLAGSALQVLAARCLDRVGKGIRGAPRDALIADITPPEQRGAAYGLRQALDSVGACLGPLAAMLGLMLWPGELRRVLAWAVVPAVLAVALLLRVREPPRAVAPARAVPMGVAPAVALGAACWRVIAIGGLLALARYSEAFLVLRANGLGVPLAQVPLVMVVMNVVYAAAAFPAGRWADRMPATRLLAAGLLLLALADALLARTQGLALLWCGAALWGLHMALTQGLLSRLLANAAPKEARGRAFGTFNLVTGVAALLASALAGSLWAAGGAPLAFEAGCALALATLACLPLLRS
jgi:MFS family permease